MSFNKISGLAAATIAAVPIGLGAGEAFMLPVGQGIVGAFGSVVTPQIAAGNPLSGQYIVQLGMYSTLQVFDTGLQYWRNIHVLPFNLVTVSSDGTNYRIANTTGCPVGALITNAGSGGTNGWYGFINGVASTIVNGVVSAGNSVFTITPSAGASQWNAIVGGAVNTTISLAGTVYTNGPFSTAAVAATGSGGANYTKPPLIIFTPPPNQGAQPYVLPTAICTISGGAINSVTVLEQGAGLLGLPGITVIPQPGDTTGAGAVLGWLAANVGQVGSGTVLAMYPAASGTPLTAVPTFTYGGSSNPAPTATAIMNFTITGFTNTTAGVGYVNAGGVIWGGIVAGSAANTNPFMDKALSIPIAPPINVAATTGVPSLAGPFQGCNYQAVPSYSAFSTGAAPSTAAVQPPTVGGANDVITLMSI
jgi:hypothetical protein